MKFRSVLALAFATITLVAACRSPTPADVLGTRTTPGGDWYCDASDTGEWACVKESERAVDQAPRQTRSTSPSPVRSASPGNLPVEAPSRASALAALPGHFYAVQLIALESQAAVAEFGLEIGVSGTMQVRIENDGKLWHLLLLGTYAERAAAERAVASLPEDLQALSPWLRLLGPLQEAMRRADAAPGG